MLCNNETKFVDYIRKILLFILLAVPLLFCQSSSKNLIPNGNFSKGKIGELPDGWKFKTPTVHLAPRFALVKKDGKNFVEISGNNNPICVGYIHTKVLITLGKTYEFKVFFKISNGLNPQENLLFQAFSKNRKDGIFKFYRLEKNMVEGAAKIKFPGKGKDSADVRIVFRLSKNGRALIKKILLFETTPIRSRWIKVACMQGKPNLTIDAKVLDMAGKHHADIALLPEMMRGGFILESLYGPSFKLMSEKAKKYHMYVAGGIIRKNSQTGIIHNTALLINRKGELVGTYEKIHPYSPDINDDGVTPGKRTPVFSTDFGRVSFMICYDSWFPDVAQLDALKGAEIILFPNAGYYRSLMSARAADNNVRIVASSWNAGYGIWDTIGRDILKPQSDPSYEPAPGKTYRGILTKKLDSKHGVLIASLDLNCSPSPQFNGGTMMQSPGGRRNLRNQKYFLEKEIMKQRERWWTSKTHYSYTAVPKVTIINDLGNSFPKTIKLTSFSKNAKIYYTLDGSIPDENSRIYTHPITINKPIELRTFARAAGAFSSNFVTKNITGKNNGIDYQYYEGFWKKVPDFKNLKSVRSGVLSYFNVHNINHRPDHFAVRYTGRLRINKGGEYTFYTNSDDGSKLFIDGKMVVDNDGSHGPREKRGNIKLIAGMHEIKVLYFEDYEGQLLDVLFKGPGIPKQSIPDILLFK